MDSSLIAKQQFLSKEILDKGYNSNNFLAYLKSKKANGDNLDKWSMTELHQYVTEFQMLIKQSTVSIDEKPPKKKNIRSSSMSMPISMNKQSLSSSFKDIEKVIHCLPPDKTDLSEIKNMHIILSFPEKKKEGSGGLGKKFVISFIIQSKPINLKVRRNLEDFFWLRDIMRKLYPGVYIPPINTKPIEESTKDAKIEKRMKNYERFMNMITNDQLLRSSKIFHDFISTTKETEFQLKMRAYDKLLIPKNMSHIQSLNGVVQINLDIGSNSSFWNKTIDDIQSNTLLLKKLIQTYKTLLNDINQVSLRFNELSKIFSEIASLSTFSIISNTTRNTTNMSTRTSNRNITTENNNYNQLMKPYDNMSNLMMDFSYFYRKQSIIFDLDMTQHIKFLINEYNVFRELKDDYANSKVIYDKCKEKLDKRKDDLYKKKDVKKWELNVEDTNIDPNDKTLAYEKMLPNETNELIELKKYSYYLGSSFENELKKIDKIIEMQNYEILNDIYAKTKVILKELEDSLETPK